MSLKEAHDKAILAIRDVVSSLDGYDAVMVEDRLNAAAMNAIRVCRKFDTGSADQSAMMDLIVDLQSNVADAADYAESQKAALLAKATQASEALVAFAKAVNAYTAETNNSNIHALHSREVRKQVWGMTGGKCAYCGGTLIPDGTPNTTESFCVEHVVPRSAGGPDNIANFVPSCLGCNSAKGSKHVLDFIQASLHRLIVTRIDREEAQQLPMATFPERYQ